MTGADVAGLVVLGVVVAGGIAYVVMQKNKTAPANFGPYVQPPAGAPTYSAPPLVSAQPPPPTYAPPAQPAPSNGSQYASGEALAWVNTIGGLVNSLGQTALGYVNQFSGA